MLFLHRVPVEAGQGLVEYALLLLLIAIVVIVIVTVLGEQIEAMYQLITDCLPEPAPFC